MEWLRRVWRGLRYRLAKLIYPEIFGLCRSMFDAAAASALVPRPDVRVIVMNEEGARQFTRSGGGGQVTECVQ